MATGTKLKNKTSLNWDQSAQERGGRMMDTGGNYRQIIFDNFSTFFFDITLFMTFSLRLSSQPFNGS